MRTFEDQTIESYYDRESGATFVLVAPKRHAKFRNYQEDLRLLQDAGVAEPD
jgi:hypothetical protein